jgi:hypothetical protein
MIAILLVATVLGAAPASAAKPSEQTITYRGYTLSWSASDASDLRVTRSGRAEHFPARASQRSISDAKARVNAASESTTQATDSCNFVPDRFGAADFTRACDNHDTCYSNTMHIDRATCDALFFADLISACNSGYPNDLVGRTSCYAVAFVYYVGVRLFGASFYTGNGSRT